MGGRGEDEGGCKTRLARQGGGADDRQHRAVPQRKKENFYGLKVVRGGQVAPLDYRVCEEGERMRGECKARLAVQGGGLGDGQYRAVPRHKKENFQGLKVVRGERVAPLD